VRTHPQGIVGSLLAITVVLGGYAATHLSIDSDNTKMVDDDVPSQIAHHEFSRLFPILDNALIAVIDGATPELSRDAARQLRAALEARPDQVRHVFEPGGGEFFERNGLLYQNLEDLENFSDDLIRAQPLIAALERDPSIENLSEIVRLGLDHLGEEEEAGLQWGDVLDRVSEAAVAVYSEYPIYVSWEDVFLRGSALEVQTRRVLMVEPVLDFGSILPAGAAIEAIRDSAAALGLSTERGVTVRVTGNPALNHEEMLGLAWDIGISGFFCFLLVAFVVQRALRSTRLMIAALLTLLVGLVWTAAFAAAAVGSLNLVSICFAILFIGLGIDFAIHLGMHYAQLRQKGADHAEALEHSASGVGASLVLCTCTTAIGFFAFVPTDYRGVAELGLIAGTGMFVTLFMTLTLFPALLTTWFRFEPDADAPAELHLSGPWSGWIERHAAGIRRGALALGVLGLAIVPGARFDPDVVDMRNPDTESVQAFRDLLDDNTLTSPWYANALADDLASSDELAARFRELEEVGQVLTLSEFVPRDQADKRWILDDLDMLLAPSPRSPLEDGKAPASPEAQIAALRELSGFLGQRARFHHDSPLGDSMDKLRLELSTFLRRVDAEPDPQPALDDLAEILLGNFPDQLSRLRGAFAPDEISLASLPPQLTSRMVASDGRHRVQVFPRVSLNEPLAIQRFVDAIYTVDDHPTGLAVNLVSFGNVTVKSLIQAVSIALITIALLLYLLWREVEPVALVLGPLLLGAILTVAGTVAFGVPFNFANVIVVPLLLGMGVDSGIHLVHRARTEELASNSLLETTTARAVLFSALTTVVSFGSLSFSSHRGMASLGQLLVIGMLLMLFANLVVLPALLTRRSSAERTTEPRTDAAPVRNVP
jgi:hopanoid biosynthesis associated RND transporter like protein HpnN